MAKATRIVAPRSVSYRLPWPPSVNHYWGRIGNRSFIGARGKEFRREVLASVDFPPDFTGRLAVCVELTPPDRRRRDIDNTQKAVLDALAAAGVYGDDCQIDELIIRRLPVCSPGCVDVTITEIEVARNAA